ncbi:MAG: phosphoribosylamine--glycine ligase [Anaerolineae bacterium]|nr:phosphoribosylamine--glycine ligase [Anaerolineae bacterium]
MAQKKVLVVGSGGREHTLAWALSRSPQVGQVYVAPGNAGTEWPANLNSTGLQPRASSQNVAVGSDDIAGLVELARREAIDLTVVGPEAPLAAGLVDAFQAARLPVFGPTQQAARLEASKAFAKDFMKQHNIPTGAYAVFDDYEAALGYLDSVEHQVVVKADGLAAGKGVLICDDIEQARAAVATVMVERAFGAAGQSVVIEERLVGPEISILAWCDGRQAVPIIPARDHKRAYDNDQGPNTGGMGAFTPAPDVDGALVAEAHQTILQPVMDGMAAQGTPYVGILYAGLMLTANGPKVLEFNCRFGDPETQAVLPLLESDIYEIFQACVAGRLTESNIAWQPGACATIVMASPGYPGNYPKGLLISGLEAVAWQENAIVFHAGTVRSGEGVVTAGGRVLAVSAVGDELAQALGRAYAGVEQIQFEGAHYRQDIGRIYQ